jgi:hypothetical protein
MKGGSAKILVISGSVITRLAPQYGCQVPQLFLVIQSQASLTNMP